MIVRKIFGSCGKIDGVILVIPSLEVVFSAVVSSWGWVILVEMRVFFFFFFFFFFFLNFCL